MAGRKKILTDFDKQIAELYYTPQEAQRVLGMDRDKFNNYVRRGTIKKHTVLGPHGYFLRSDIDGLAERIEATLLAAETKNLIFRPAKVEDMDAINHLAYYHFGDGVLTPERKEARQNYIKTNKESTFCLLNGEKLLASIDILPLKHDAILEFKEGKRGWQFPKEAIMQYKIGEPLELIIIDMMTTLNASPRMRETYAADLLRGLSKKFGEWAQKGIEIKTIDACGGTELGRRILESAGFEYTGEKQPRRHMYHLEIEKSDLKLLKPYRIGREEYKKRLEIDTNGILETPK
jgi:hypothetical protein